MAFFCPMRIPRRRRKRYTDEEQKTTTRNGNPRGRITGSNSVDSLVELGKEEEDNEIEFEPRKMVVLHDFIPCVEDEVAVKRGQHVKALYQETDWIYILTNDGKEGFVPFTYCVAEEEYERRKEKQKGLQRNNFRNASFLDSLQVQTDTTPALNFKKNNYGDYMVRFDFMACDENDINAQKGDQVRVLNKDDKDWYWVTNAHGDEGFIPKDFLVPFDRLQNGGSSPASNQYLLNGSRSLSETQVSPLSTRVGSPYRETTPPSARSNSSSRLSETPASLLSAQVDSPYRETTPDSARSHSRTSSAEPLFLITPPSNQNGSSPVTPNGKTEAFRQRRNTNELLLYGQELVCIDSYVGKRMDELTVSKGDWIYADMKLKDGRGWIWAYSPSNKTQGFVPRSCVRPPATTPL